MRSRGSWQAADLRLRLHHGRVLGADDPLSCWAQNEHRLPLSQLPKPLAPFSTT